MSGSNQYILNQEACPTHEAWMAYAENRCDKQQVRAMEMHLLNCPLCSEAVELYMEGQGVEVKEIQNYVSQSIDNQPTVKVVPIWKRIAPFAIAASLLLGFFFLKNAENQNIVNPTSQQEAQQNAIVDNRELEKSKENPPIAIVADEINAKKAKNIEPNAALQKTEAIKVQEDNTLASNEVEKKQADVYAPAPEKTDVIATQSAATEALPSSKIATKKEMPQKENSIKEKLNIAKNYFNNQNYSQAIAAYKAILMMDTDNQEALFYLGKSEIALGNFQNAINPLERVNAPNLYDEAQWELAQSCLKINKLAKAKRVLKVLSEKENAFQNQAKELLKE